DPGQQSSNRLVKRAYFGDVCIRFALSSLLYIPLYRTYKQDREMLGHEEATCLI
ncbi:hypothetical protein MKW92_048840, partial [Papaver armeniacum]